MTGGICVDEKQPSFRDVITNRVRDLQCRRRT